MPTTCMLEEQSSPKRLHDWSCVEKDIVARLDLEVKYFRKPTVLMNHYHPHYHLSMVIIIALTWWWTRPSSIYFRPSEPVTWVVSVQSGHTHPSLRIKTKASYHFRQIKTHSRAADWLWLLVVQFSSFPSSSSFLYILFWNRYSFVLFYLIV